MRSIKLLVKKLTPQALKDTYHWMQSYAGHVRYGRPSTKLKVIGVTGTDGKTTTSLMIYSMLKAAGKKVSCITSINAKVGGKELDTGFHVTTPDAIDIQRFLAQAFMAGDEYVVLETTSHALAQKRVAAIDYNYAVLTNVTHEHLDFHKTFETYLKAKLNLFQKAGRGTVNRDIEAYPKIAQILETKKVDVATYSLQSQADVWADYVEYARGIQMRVHVEKDKDFEVSCPLEGAYNAYNILAAISCVHNYGIKSEAIIQGLSDMKPLAGRMERLDFGQPYVIYVDFAHTPYALETVLKELRKKTAGRLISVFGCAGLRDFSKRPMMGKIAATYAHYCVFTAEDPRTEDVNEIIQSMAQGALDGGAQEAEVEGFNSNKGGKPQFFKIPDRRQAIEFTLKRLVKPNDIVVITGKGHEKSMCFGFKEFPWSDQQVVGEVLGGK